jgi:hypothetical protein
MLGVALLTAVATLLIGSFAATAIVLWHRRSRARVSTKFVVTTIERGDMAPSAIRVSKGNIDFDDGEVEGIPTTNEFSSAPPSHRVRFYIDTYPRNSYV